jgi:hypothetical protein
MYYSPADLSVWFRLKGKSRKTFDIIIPTKYVFFKLRFWGDLGGCSLAGPPVPPPGASLDWTHLQDR